MIIQELLEQAKRVNGKYEIGRQYSAGNVSAAILAAKHKVYTGINIEITCGIGFCAEHSAIANMLKDRETRILASVAVLRDQILPPCGRCRELMMLINPENAGSDIYLAEKHFVKLAELLPHHWLDSSPPTSIAGRKSQ